MGYGFEKGGTVVSEYYKSSDTIRDKGSLISFLYFIRGKLALYIQDI